jgi:tetratricopeptide (TPR) repeat protein
MTTVAQMYSLALQYHREGHLREAEQLYRQILHLEPDHAATHHMLGVLASQVGQFDLAIKTIRHALELTPAVAEYHSNLGLAHQAIGQLEEAVTHYQEALRLKPDFPEAHICLGNAFHLQGKLEKSVDHCRQALRIQPDNVAAYVNLGNALLDQGKVEEAIVAFRHALRISPHLAEAHSNLATAFTRQERFDEAIQCYREALRLKPNYAAAYFNLATIAQVLGHFDEAAAFYEQSFSCDAQFAVAHLNRSFLWLLRANFAKGWSEYEWRWRTTGFQRPAFDQPRWDGSELHGRTILLYAEQGLGDTLQFIRYVPGVRQRGGRAIVQCQAPLQQLLASMPGIEELVPEGASLPAFDVQAPLLSLPGIFNTSLQTLPSAVPYLAADADLVTHWQRRLDALQGFKVGIAWQGNPTFRNDRLRSIPLNQWNRLAQVEGVHLISLQKGPGTEQLAKLRGQFSVVDLGESLDEASGAFMDTAAIMMNLDLVISSDSAVPHLAGALGVPVWVALPLAPDWRWLLEREDSPWYPTMRLFRQQRYGNWDDVFERMAEELRRFTGR